jgi:hypothetical protein
MAPWLADNVCPRLPFPPERLLPLAERPDASVLLPYLDCLQLMNGWPTGPPSGPLFAPGGQLCGSEIRAMYVSSGSSRTGQAFGEQSVKELTDTALNSGAAVSA